MNEQIDLRKWAALVENWERLEDTDDDKLYREMRIILKDG